MIFKTCTAAWDQGGTPSRPTLLVLKSRTEYSRLVKRGRMAGNPLSRWNFSSSQGVWKIARAFLAGRARKAHFPPRAWIMGHAHFFLQIFGLRVQPDVPLTPRHTGQYVALRFQGRIQTVFAIHRDFTL